MSRYARAESALGRIVTQDGPAFSLTADAIPGVLHLQLQLVEQHTGIEVVQGALHLVGSFVEVYTAGSVGFVVGQFDSPNPPAMSGDTGSVAAGFGTLALAGSGNAPGAAGFDGPNPGQSL